ncbi:MAG: glycosyltransferase family 39 protein, partial [Acidimicrobiales bacterium]
MSIVSPSAKSSETGLASDPAQKPRSGRDRAFSLPVQILLLSIMLFGILAMRDPDAGFTSDDGAYGGQVRALENGTWALERPLAVVSADNEGWVNTTVLPEGPVPSPRHPSHIYLLSLFADLFGETIGLRLPAAIGTALTATLGWKVAQEIDQRAGLAGFWIAALSPQLINSTALWAHSISAMLAGVATWALLRIHRYGIRPATLLALSTALSAGVLLRSEAVFLAAAFTTAALIARHRALAISTVVASAAAGLAFLVDRAWTIRIVGRGVALEPATLAESSAG